MLIHVYMYCRSVQFSSLKETYTCNTCTKVIYLTQVHDHFQYKHVFTWTPSMFRQSVQVQMSSDHTLPCPFSGGWEGEQEDAGGVEVHVGGVVDQWPDIRDEELLRRFLLHILKLQVREFLKVIKTCQFNIVHWYCITVLLIKLNNFVVTTYFSFDWVLHVNAVNCTFINNINSYNSSKYHEKT